MRVEGQARPIAAIALALAMALPATVAARQREAATAAQLRTTIAAAQPGDVITIRPGTYELPRTVIAQSGRPGRPITVRAARAGTVEIRTRASELFKIAGSDWVFENLDIAGVCAVDAQCEHAFHIVGGADRTVIRHDRLRDFNAQIKGNGEHGRYPRDVAIDGNTLFDTHLRAIAAPLAAVDVVGGRRWVVRDNLIADFGKTAAHPPRIADDFGYAIFLKGNSSHGVIERNIVICALTQPPAPFTRGISLGGSGTDPGLCETNCATEHRDGLIRGNLVVDCPTGFGINLYKASNSQLAGNVVIDTEGILARSPQTSAIVDDNSIISGELAATEGARLILGRNLLADLPGSPASIVDAGDGKTFQPAAAGPPPRLTLSAQRENFCPYLRQMAAAAGPSRYPVAGCAGIAARIADYREYARTLQPTSPAGEHK
ncbi:MAG TPA: hypothetical protein VKQ73_00245 [Stellaceae bacterium]|nr:hypothetical protein [Stellaceae bacterium]